MAENSYHLKIDSNSYLKFLAAVVVLFVLIHCALNYYNYQISETQWLIHQLFDLDEENNLPTWFSSFLLANNALALYVISQGGNEKYNKQWLGLALGFLILSIDETAGLHESFNTAVEFNWAIAGGVLVFIFALAYIPFLLSLDRRLAFWFVLSGTIFISGALGIELLAADMDEDAMSYGFATALEEGLEMLGALLFLRANLQQVNNFNGQLSKNMDITIDVG